VSDAAAPASSRLTAVLRGDDERVTPLELFFDLVFVLAITQCTALMSHEHSWEGIAKGVLVLGILWWAWVGYSWLTSVVDLPEPVVPVSSTIPRSSSARSRMTGGRLRSSIVRMLIGIARMTSETEPRW